MAAPQSRPLMLAAVLSLAFSGCWAPPERATSPPNVVLLVIDTLRADHLPLYGYERDTAPHLSELAEDGIVFHNAFSTAPWTTPSVAAMLTGRYPDALGIVDEPIRLPPGAPRLASIVSEQGFTTHGVVSHTYVGRELGFDAGFDTWDETQTGDESFVSSPGVTATALRVLEARSDAPFFLFAHYFDPHWNYLEHAEYRFDESAPAYSKHASAGIWKLRAAARRGKLGEDQLQRVIDAYDTEIRFTDAHIGQLLDYLREQDLYDDALIIVTADHGEAFMERSTRWIGHTRQVHQELIRVPLIVKPPGDARSRAVDDYVSTIDLFPTILDAIGAPADVASIDLDRSLLRDTSERTIFAATARIAKRQAVAQNGWKLMRNMKTGTMQLFRLAEDPGERVNVADQHPEIVARLETLRFDWADQVAKSRITGGEPVEHDSEEIDRLRALGYVE